MKPDLSPLDKAPESCLLFLPLLHRWRVITMPQKWFSLVFGDENRVERPLQTSEDELYGRDYFDLKQGKRISNWNPKSTLRSTSREDDGDPDDILCEHLRIPTLSQ